MQFLSISVLSWLAGLLAYLVAVKGFFGQPIASGDLHLLTVWSALAGAIAIAICYGPAMFAFRNRVNADRVAGWFVFPLFGASVGFLPVAFIEAVFSENLGCAPIWREAGSLYCGFGVLGAVFGSGFFAAYGRRSV